MARADDLEDPGALRERNAFLERELQGAEERLARGERWKDELERSERRFRTIFNHSNDAIFLVDVEQDAILDVNAKASAMLGYSREELLALPMSVIHPHEMQKVRAFARSVFEKGSGFTNGLTCLTKSRAILSAEISASILEIEGRPCMIASVRDVTDRDRLVSENEYLCGEIRSGLRFDAIIGQSAGMRDVLSRIEQVAPTDTAVLITGESGTGKELVARAIHEHGARRGRALVRVNCASIPKDLFESEFFGHVKGAFTSAVSDRKGRFEVADGGTIFLDEVGEIPLGLQSKLLRVLQEGELERIGENHTRRVDVRVIAATNRDLEAACESGEFRRDLFFRLGVFLIRIPPLRERQEDIEPLVLHYVDAIGRRLGKPGLRIRPAEIRALEAYAWPGNVRELQNVIERGTILAAGRDLRLDPHGTGSGEAAGSPAGSPPVPLAGAPAGGGAGALVPRTLEDVRRIERDLIREALQASGGKLYGEDGAAARLGVKPTTLAYRIKKMGIRRGEGSPAAKTG